MYAEIVVNAPLSRRRVPFLNRTEGFAALGQTFTYAVPEHLAGQLRPGHLVTVPFGVRKLQGIVMELAEQPTLERIKEVYELVDPLPVLTPAQLGLARWLSQYYFAPLIDCILVMFPPGLEAEVQTTLSFNPEAMDATATAPVQQALIERLRAEGTRPLDVLLRGTGGRALSKNEARDTMRAIDGLVRKRILVRRADLMPPRAKAKIERTAQLIAEPSAEVLAALKTKSALAVIDYLLKRGGVGTLVARSDINKATGATAATYKTLAEANVIRLDEHVIWRDPLAGQVFAHVAPPTLTAEQRRVWDMMRLQIAASLKASSGPPTFLVFGVTGSGKTEIYMRAVSEALSRGQQAIVLVPEIALTPQTIRRFAERFPGEVTVVHSRLSAGERFDQWRRIRAGEVRVVIGSRSALFAPLPQLGLIVLDEEHEPSYKQEQSPNYHARETALAHARLTNATVILGSATPSLESMWKAKRGDYRLLELRQRVANADGADAKATGAANTRFVRTLNELVPRASGTAYTAQRVQTVATRLQMPPVEIVDMRAELKSGNTSIFSRSLRDALNATLAAREQVILFLNRRGTATFVMCRDCGYVMHCRRCDTPLTYHTDQAELVCHHCNRRYQQPATCPNCGSKRIRQFGAGTQKVEEEVQRLYPTARILRWDRDVTGTKGAHEAILSKFKSHEADVLVGTQMVAKGLDLPLVTLVGVVSADTGLHLPDFRASERTFQLLTQVAGRAGRSRLLGKAIFQTYTPAHPAILAAAQHDFEQFYEGEIAFRKQLNYPPFSRLIRLLYAGSGEERAQRESDSLKRGLEQRIRQLALTDVDLIGPVPCFLYRMRGAYRWQIIVRGQEPQRVLHDFILPLGWRVDVDPMSVL